MLWRISCRELSDLVVWNAGPLAEKDRGQSLNSRAPDLHRFHSARHRLCMGAAFFFAFFFFCSSEALCRQNDSGPTVESEQEKPSPPGLPEDSDGWDIPSNDRSKWDWLLLTTGEWLKGSIDVLRENDLEFYSDKFDDLTFDFYDVAGFQANRIHTYVFKDRSIVTGQGTLRGQELTVGGVTYNRENLTAIIEGEQNEHNYWSGKLNLGFSLMMGNTEQATLTSSGYIRRESPYSRLTVAHTGSYGRVSGDVNVQNLTGLAQGDIFLTERWYIIPLFGIAAHDRFQNVEIRAIPGAGSGVHLFQTKLFEWKIEFGAGYQYQKYREVVPGEDQTIHDGIVRFFTAVEIDTSMVDIDLIWWSILVYTDWDTTSHHGELTFEFEITEILDLTVSAIYDRIESPESYEEEDTSTTPPTTVTVTPKSDDLKLTVGLAVEF